MKLSTRGRTQEQDMASQKAFRQLRLTHQLQRIRQLHAEGHTDPTIAQRLRMKRETVTARRQALGLPANAREY